MLRSYPAVGISRGEPCQHCASAALADDDAASRETQRAAAPRRRRPAVRPPLVDDPSLGAILEELDLALDADAAVPYLAPPSLIDRLLVPLSDGSWSEVVHTDPAAFATADPISEANLRDLEEELLDGPDSLLTPSRLIARLPGPTDGSVRHTTSDWMVSATLILLVFAGAAAGALVFRERLSDIVVHWQTRLE